MHCNRDSKNTRSGPQTDKRKLRNSSDDDMPLKKRARYTNGRNHAADEHVQTERDSDSDCENANTIEESIRAIAKYVAAGGADRNERLAAELTNINHKTFKLREALARAEEKERSQAALIDSLDSRLRKSEALIRELEDELASLQPIPRHVSQTKNSAWQIPVIRIYYSIRDRHGTTRCIDDLFVASAKISNTLHSLGIMGKSGIYKSISKGLIDSHTAQNMEKRSKSLADTNLVRIVQFSFGGESLAYLKRKTTLHHKNVLDLSRAKSYLFWSLHCVCDRIREAVACRTKKERDQIMSDLRASFLPSAWLAIGAHTRVPEHIKPPRSHIEFAYGTESVADLETSTLSAGLACTDDNLSSEEDRHASKTKRRYCFRTSEHVLSEVEESEASYGEESEASDTERAEASDTRKNKTYDAERAEASDAERTEASDAERTDALYTRKRKRPSPEHSWSDELSSGYSEAEEEWISSRTRYAKRRRKAVKRSVRDRTARERTLRAKKRERSDRDKQREQTTEEIQQTGVYSDENSVVPESSQEESD
jgi:hypothetical protein